MYVDHNRTREGHVTPRSIRHNLREDPTTTTFERETSRQQTTRRVPVRYVVFFGNEQQLQIK